MTKVIRQYADRVKDERRRLFSRLDALIRSVNPKAETLIWFGLATYRVRRGWTGWVALGYRKDGVSLYTSGGPHVVAFKRKHPDIRASKGSINLVPSGPFPVRDLKTVVRAAIGRNVR